MAAYIVGMIMGAVVTVFPMVYLMHFDRCMAIVLQSAGSGVRITFEPAMSASLITSITTIGAVVLLLSAAMMAVTGLRQQPKPAQ